MFNVFLQKIPKYANHETIQNQFANLGTVCQCVPVINKAP